MKKPTAASTETLVGASALAMPSEGGSYIRNADGSLTRVAQDAPDPTNEPPAGGDAGGTNGQEG